MTLSRAPRSYPAFFKDLLDPAEAVVPQSFQTRDEQNVWIAERVQKEYRRGVSLTPTISSSSCPAQRRFTKAATIMNSVATSMCAWHLLQSRRNYQ